MKKSFPLFVLLYSVMLSIYGQKTLVKGQITTFDVIAVERAEVTAKKAKVTVLTDSLGFFTLECEPKDKLSIKAVGFKNKQVKVKSLEDLGKINLEIAGGEGDIDLAITKGHINENSRADAKKYLNTKRPYSYGFNNMTDLVKGKFPQINIVGGALVLRGSNSISEGANNGVLLVLNGSTLTWQAVQNMEVTTIKNMKILTSTAAIRYGSGSSNGVLLIELVSD